MLGVLLCFLSEPKCEESLCCVLDFWESSAELIDQAYQVCCVVLCCVVLCLCVVLCCVVSCVFVFSFCFCVVLLLCIYIVFLFCVLCCVVLCRKYNELYIADLTKQNPSNQQHNTTQHNT